MSVLKHAQRYIANQSKCAHLNAFVSLADEAAVLSKVESLAVASRAGNAGETNLRGQLIAIKDNICTTDFPTTASSGTLKNYKSPYDATVVKQLRDAGAVVAGKTNMDAFGMGSHSTNSYFGSVKQEGYAGQERSAGGSSGGSALAVASAQCWAALGTDTGGSVRLPAAYTGVVGFKPSYGLISRWGVIAYANSLDTVGILAKNTADVEVVFGKLNTHDPRDPTSLESTTRSRLGSSKGPGSLKIGIPREYNISSLHPTVRNAWIQSLRILQQAGHTLHEVSLPTTQRALPAYYVLAPAEASSNLAKYDGVRYGTRVKHQDGTPESVLFAKTRGQGFEPEVQRRILLGAFSLSAQAIDNYFIQAQKVRRLVQQDFDKVFEAPNQLVAEPKMSKEGGVDILLCPTAPTPAMPITEIERQDHVQTYMNDVFTVPASLAGIPAISVPVSTINEERDAEAGVDDEKETVGMQIIGQYGDDKLVLNVAKELMASLV